MTDIEPSAPSAPAPSASARAADSADESDALLSRLQLIENQPLESRAAAFAQINDELQARLEGADAPRSHGDPS